jgi:hypothetical protein
VQQSKEAPKYEMPPLLDHTSKIHSMGKVSTIKGFFQSCVKVLLVTYNDRGFDDSESICGFRDEIPSLLAYYLLK